MNTACVMSQDDYFSDFVMLELSRYIPSVIRFKEGKLPTAECYIVDTDTVKIPHGLCGTVLLCGWNSEKPENCGFMWVDRPFRPARLAALLSLSADTDEVPEYRLIPQNMSVNDGIRDIILTECEYRLFAVLLEAQGRPVSREELCRQVWNSEADVGIVNVYIHYLRSKLEYSSKKVIRSIRGKGYALICGKDEENA